MTLDLKNFKYFTSPNGFTIMVGKNSIANELLTFQIANAYDIWLHTSDVPGAHVILINPVKLCINQDDIKYAAQLAINNSQIDKTKKKHLVDVCNAIDVSKKKYTKMGLVEIKNQYQVEIKNNIK